MEQINNNLFGILTQFTGRSSVFDAVIAFGADIFPYVILIILLVLIFREKNLKRRVLLMIQAVLTVLLSWGVMAQTFHTLFPFSRPFVYFNLEPLVYAVGPAFPSGHATFFFALAAMIFTFNRKWGALLLVVAFLNGICRVAARVHWPLDVMGGAFFGILSAIFVFILLTPLFLKTEKE
jgi:undecaprenyl-diphosphatase